MSTPKALSAGALAALSLLIAGGASANVAGEATTGSTANTGNVAISQAARITIADVVSTMFDKNNQTLRSSAKMAWTDVRWAQGAAKATAKSIRACPDTKSKEEKC